MIATTTHDHDVFAFTKASHELLEAQLEEVSAAVKANDRATMHRLWCEAEANLLAHLEAEERFVLPAFARTDRAEALELLRDHAKIRELLLDLGVAVELHFIRFEQLQQFGTALRAHAMREEQLLARWATTLLGGTALAASQQHLDRVANEVR